MAEANREDGLGDIPRCEARIRPMVPINDTELRCELVAHVDRKHVSKHVSTLRDYDGPGSVTVVTWLDDDRRNFTGPWVECLRPGCVLPSNHRGEHAS